MNERLLTKFILSFLVEKEDYVGLTSTQQQLVFQTCKTLMTAIYNAIKYENVYPVIMCGDVEAKQTFDNALSSVKHILPSVKKITIYTIQ